MILCLTMFVVVIVADDVGGIVIVVNDVDRSLYICPH